MKKRLLILLCVLGTAVLAAVFPSTSTRAENGNMKSHGNLSYQEGEITRIKIYSEDIDYLKNEIDRLKAEIK